MSTNPETTEADKEKLEREEAGYIPPLHHGTTNTTVGHMSGVQAGAVDMVTINNYGPPPRKPNRNSSSDGRPRRNWTNSVTSSSRPVSTTGHTRSSRTSTS